jgi:hypothetical protein
MKEQLPIAFFHLAQQPAKLVEVTRIFTGASPSDIVGPFPI